MKTEKDIIEEKCLLLYILMNNQYKDWQFKAIKEILI